jgi:predicted nuclease with RNAse H fold
VKRSFAKSWVLRSIGLYRQLRGAGFVVHEVYPYASKRLLFGPQMAAKQTSAGRVLLASALTQLGIVLPRQQLSHHELDAIVAAHTVYLLAHGRAELVGDAQEGYIVIPGGVAKP